MSDRIRLALVQADFPVGAVEDNPRRILSLRAEAPDANLLVLPEGALSGYPLRDLVLRPGFVARAGAALEAPSPRWPPKRSAAPPCAPCRCPPP